MVMLASNGILGFSTAPLKLALSSGLFLAVASVLYGMVAITLKLAGFCSVLDGYAPASEVVGWPPAVVRPEGWPPDCRVGAGDRVRHQHRGVRDRPLTSKITAPDVPCWRLHWSLSRGRMRDV